MIRSLRTAISGLKANQVRMDVIGNNIANVNTTAFKRSRATFGEVLGQQLLGVGRTAGGSGINPSVVGLGVAVASIDQNWGQGSLENTNVGTDLALNGDGFFVVRNQDRNVITRAGNFSFNRLGEFVTANGLNVQGFGFNADGTVDTGELRDIKISPDLTAPPLETSNVTVGGNLSSDLADGEIITVSTGLYDSQGETHTVLLRFEKTGTDAWSVSAELTDGTPVAGGGAVTFDADGNITSPDPAAFPLTGTYPGGGDADDLSLTLNLANVKQYSGSSTATVRQQDGYGTGILTGYGINPQGVLELNFSNGYQQKLFQLAVGNVTNANGLDQLGENFYGENSASGPLQIGRAGYEFRTAVVSGTLEMSNVDLASEFTDMIVTQRGYQASARVITTSDEILQETVQLKR